MMTERTIEELAGDNDALRTRLAKLERINAALMDRVERSTDMQGSAFAMFETAIALETMVRERTGELSEVNRRLEAEVAERRTIEAELTEAKTAAEKANLSKTSFLAAASHDLLQPLNAARLFIAALAERRLALPTRALVNQTSTALDSVEDLLEALLEISRLDAGAIQPELTHFRIDRLLETLKIEFGPTARAAGLEFTIEAGPLWVQSDVRLLRRILQNFISNAIRYTAKGSVRVLCATEGESVRLSVKDTGPGIPVDKQELIFEEFLRLNCPSRTPGKGLGLAIVRRASEMLRHPIALSSRPGKGSCFSITLPLGQEVRDREEQRHRHGRDGSVKGLSILVIDNDRQIQAGMRTLLSGWGCAVATADGFDSAAAQFGGEERPDIIIVDYHLNDGRTGDAVVEQLHAHFGAPIPTVMISADRSEMLKDRLDALAMPMLNKPVKPAQLRALLSTMVR